MPKTRLRIVHFDVSQGESSLISLFPAVGRTIHVLIDGGKLSRGKYVLKILEGMGVTRLDYIVCTHPDGDHHEGLIPIVEASDRIDSKVLLAPEDVYDPYKYTKLKNACSGSGVTWEDAQVGRMLINTAGCTLQIVHVGKSPMGDDNPASIGCKLKLNSFVYFTAGDLPFEKEEKLALGGHVCAFKCGHHGAETSTSETFLGNITPTAAFISAGHHNHDHPRQSVLNLLRDCGSVQGFYATNCEPDRTGFVGRGGSGAKKGVVASARENGVLGHVVLFTDEDLSKQHDGANTTFQVLHPSSTSGEVASWRVYSHPCGKQDYILGAVDFVPGSSTLTRNELPEYRLHALSTTIQGYRSKIPTFSVVDLIAKSKERNFRVPSSPIREYMKDPQNFLKDTSLKRGRDEEEEEGGEGGNGRKKRQRTVFIHPGEDVRMSRCAGCNDKARGKGTTVQCRCSLDWYVCRKCQWDVDRVTCEGQPLS